MWLRGTDADKALSPGSLSTNGNTDPYTLLRELSHVIIKCEDEPNTQRDQTHELLKSTFQSTKHLF